MTSLHLKQRWDPLLWSSGSRKCEKELPSFSSIRLKWRESAVSSPSGSALQRNVNMETQILIFYMHYIESILNSCIRVALFWTVKLYSRWCKQHSFSQAINYQPSRTWEAWRRPTTFIQDHTSQPQTVQSFTVWKTLVLLLQSQQLQGQCHPPGYQTVTFITKYHLLTSCL